MAANDPSHLPIPTELRKAIARVGLSQRRVAAKAEISASSLTGYLNGRDLPKGKTAIRLAEILGMNPRFVMGLDNDQVEADKGFPGFSAALRWWRERKDLSQAALAAAADVPPDRLFDFETDSAYAKDTEVARLLEVLVGGPEPQRLATFFSYGEKRTPPRTPSGKDLRSLPLVGAAAAGEPMDKIYEMHETQWMDFPDAFLKEMYKHKFDPERAVMLRVSGESMDGELMNGAIVWVDRGPGGEGIEHVNDDDIYMVRPPDEPGITLKRVAIEGTGDNRVLQLLPSGKVVGRYKVRTIPLKGRRIQSIVRGRVVGQFHTVGRIGKVM